MILCKPVARQRGERVEKGDGSLQEERKQADKVDYDRNDAGVADGDIGSHLEVLDVPPRRWIQPEQNQPGDSPNHDCARPRLTESSAVADDAKSDIDLSLK